MQEPVLQSRGVGGRGVGGCDHEHRRELMASHLSRGDDVQQTVEHLREATGQELVPQDDVPRLQPVPHGCQQQVQLTLLRHLHPLQLQRREAGDVDDVNPHTQPSSHLLHHRALARPRRAEQVRHWAVHLSGHRGRVQLEKAADHAEYSAIFSSSSTMTIRSLPTQRSWSSLPLRRRMRIWES